MMMKGIDSRDLTLRISNNDFSPWRVKNLTFKKAKSEKTSSVWEAFSLFASVVIFMKSYNIFMTRH